MADESTIDIGDVEREVGALPGAVREALLAFSQGQPVRRLSRVLFRRGSAHRDVDEVIARLDALCFEEI